MSTEAMIQQIAEYFKTQPVLKAWLFGYNLHSEQRREAISVNLFLSVRRF